MAKLDACLDFKHIALFLSSEMVNVCCFWQPVPKQPALQHTTLQRHVRAHRNVNIPRFHFPTGKPTPAGQQDIIKSAVSDFISCP